MKRNKGITLVALVITIIILIILASVTFSMVLGQNGLIEKSKDGADRYKEEASREQNEINNVTAFMDSILTGNGTTPSSNPATQTQTYTISYNANGGTGEMEDSTNTVSDNEFIKTNYTFNGWNTLANGTGTNVEVGTTVSSNITLYAQWQHTEAYSMGETVVLGGEEFWVVSDSGSDVRAVKLLAKLNVITTEGNENRYKQNESANMLRYDDDSSDYESSEIKIHVENYKTAVEERMGEGKTILEARLLTGKGSWGGRIASGEIKDILDSSLPNKNEIAYGTDEAKLAYWLGENYGDDCEWYASNASNGVYQTNVDERLYCGLRPVLIVLKTYL